ncbi:Carnosine synthase 1 [Arachnomyces sp. PD_36]|nr:Carnosine synthase 1 [Arachnomyces sp. PD_36]
MAIDAELFVTLKGAEAYFDCSWEKQEHSPPTEASQFCSVDIILKRKRTSCLQWPNANGHESDPRVFIKTPSPEHLDEIKPESFGDGAPMGFDFLLASLERCFSEPEAHEQALRLIIPQRQGFIVRSDIFNLRLFGCPFVSSVASFCKPNRHFTQVSRVPSVSSVSRLPEIFSASCAGLLLLSSENVRSNLKVLDYELENRLSFPWLMEKTGSRQTLVIVEGGKSPETGRNLFMAAKALNISIIVLDRPGHWLEGPEYADWREAFIPIDRNPDVKFPDRIVEALEGYKKGEGASDIDGLVTFFDPLFVGVAAAAKKLGLPTSSPEAYAVATDKFKTSIAEGRSAYCASGPEQVAEIIREANALTYPLIVKPCSGWGSEGVFRVKNTTELEYAVRAIDFDRHGKNIVIEEYCGGPEVDANFVLVDSEVVFFEASDDFPKDADGDGDSALKTFIETANVLPSALPQDEIAVLKSALHHSLLRLGFKDGFFHLEARVHNSSLEFRKDETSGLVDLGPKKATPIERPTAWLIEINPRPPGVQALLASAYTYGVDYIGISLCFALQRKEAAKALSVPFNYERVGNGAQYWCEVVFIPVVKGGIFESDNVCAELQERRPDLAKYVSKSHCFFQRGDTVTDPSSGLLNWIAYYLVFSLESRAHVLKVAASVRNETKFLVT